MSISRRIVDVADSILLATALLTLIAAPVMFVALSARDTPSRVPSPFGLDHQPNEPAATPRSCRCTSSNLDAEFPVRWARRRPTGTP
jgi:putative salt-induced outer membrane protein YdiY